MRATYRRPHGAEQFLGFDDVHADCLSGLFRRRKRVVDVSAAFRRLRACYPRKRLLVIMDNLHNVHDHPRFLALLRRLRITPVWTPTEASWLNLTLELARPDDGELAAGRRTPVDEPPHPMLADGDPHRRRALRPVRRPPSSIDSTCDFPSAPASRRKGPVATSRELAW